MKRAGMLAGLAAAGLSLPHAGVSRGERAGASGAIYVSPAGSPRGSGTRSSPLDLATALSGGAGRIGAGDTIWVLGGTYRGPFNATVSGAQGSPVVIRAVPGERAIIDGGTTTPGVTVLRLGGAWTEFWGLEITNSDPVRTSPGTSHEARPAVMATYAPHIKLIGLIVHDGGVALYTEPKYGDIEIADCIFYNNGWQGPDRGHGHALYLKSFEGPVIARDNVIFNQFGYGIHVYTNSTTGKLNNIRLEDNVTFDNGTLATGGGSSNILLGGDATAAGDVVQNNDAWFASSVSSTNVIIGRGTLLNEDVQVAQNRFIGGSPVLDVGYWTTMNVTGNTIAGSKTTVALKTGSTNDRSWSGNTIGHEPAGAAPTIVIHKRAYLGGAVIVVYNWNRAGSVNVDLSSVLGSGDRYEIRNVQDLFGSPLAQGTFNGRPLALSMAGVTPPVPVGLSASRAPRTGPDFDVFIVDRK